MARAGSDDERRRGPYDDTLPASEPPQDAVAATQASASMERYRLGAELGRGGMGRVVEAFDLQLGRTVALKEVLPKASASGTLRRFEREVQLTARLEHPSIVPIYDSGTTPDGRPFYVMRRVSGRPFDELVQRARGLDERLTLLPALLAAIDAVGHAHRRGVIHRDIKPQNILVGELGETIVIDWGLAKVIGEEDDAGGESAISAGDSLQTQIGSVFGTPGFMSPEQARGEELGTRGDVFALGATLYQLLAGTPPHQGNSATEVIDKTARHDVRPLAEVAPGAPPELVAIVDKALSFEARKRYPNAGALGEDVRRFLAGQLVAAHNYTKRQRVARFARRHRAPLGVAALALVAVAVLAWIGVARIITERDAAGIARAEAERNQRVAELRTRELSERHDALVVTQARALLESNPTEAAAVLKGLSETSARAADARAIAQAAATRGVAWAVESTPELSLIAELEPGGRRLLQVGRDGVVRVWDVEVRRSVLARPYARDTRAMWVSNGRVLVMHAKSPPQLLDPVANTSEPLPIDPIVDAAATANGDLVVFTTAARGAKLLDLGTRAVRELDRDRKIDDVASAADGSWFALVGKDAIVVVDAAGRELARRAGPHARAVPLGSRALGVIAYDGSVAEWRKEPRPARAGVGPSSSSSSSPPAAPGTGAGWTQVPLALPSPHRPIDLIYRGEELAIWATTGAVFAWNGERVYEQVKYERMSSRLHVAGRDGETVIVAGVDGKLHYFNDVARGTLVLPSIVPHARIAARAGSTNVIVVGDGIVVGFDLAAVTPRLLHSALGTQATFVDDDTLLATAGSPFEWQWIDVHTGAARPFAYQMHGLPVVIDVDPPSGRVLLRERGGPVERLVMMHKGSDELRVITEGRAVWGRLLQGDALVYAVGDGRLFGQLGTAQPREIAKLDGVVDSAVELGHRRYAARSTGGELVRGDLTIDSLERARVAAGASGFVAADRTGRVLVVEDTRLMEWEPAGAPAAGAAGASAGGAIVELARFDRPIVRLEPYEGGVTVHMPDFEVQALALAPGAVPARVLAPSKIEAWVSHDAELLVGLGPAQQLHVVELPAGARWTLPVLFHATDVLAVAPSARRVLQGTDRHLVMWTLPRAGPNLGAWLDELTNASVDDRGVFAWPWQRLSGGAGGAGGGADAPGSGGAAGAPGAGGGAGGATP